MKTFRVGRLVMTWHDVPYWGYWHHEYCCYGFMVGRLEVLLEVG